MITRFKNAAAGTLLALCLSQAAQAAPVGYKFDYKASDIGFTYTFNGEVVQGSFPAFTGDLVVDFKDMRNSTVTVAIDASKGKGGFIFATSALRGPKVLATDTYPTISFTSTDAMVSKGKTTVDGNITVRGVTKPITLNVRFLQQIGQDPEKLDPLQMVITGRINRDDFGASGYPDMVGPFLDITINAKITKK